MTVKLRFAPSPTGLLHIGNIRTAILNWLYARQQGGHFLLRFDDTDLERSREEFVDAAKEDLAWLGLAWDDIARQSERTAHYNEAAAVLRAAGRLYPCYETPEELDRKRKIQRAQGLPPVYDRTGLRQTAEDRARLEAEGRRPHWRFLLAAHGETASAQWDDLVRGPQSIDVAALSDPVLIRADGSYLYTFTSVVDDRDFEITHVVRGEDHVTNSAVQIRLFEALDAAPPAFAHHALLVGADGQALSKRLGALSIRSMREAGFEPMAVASHAALVGTSDAIEPHKGLESLVDNFAFAKVSRAPARFDLDDLRGLNARLLHETPYETVRARLGFADDATGRAFWQAVRGNVERFADHEPWRRVVFDAITPIVEDEKVCASAAERLPPEPWDEATWGTWTAAVREATGAKGRALFHPLRKALTAADRGPELKDLLPLMGRARVQARLRGETA